MKAFQTVVATLFMVAFIIMLSLFSEKIWDKKEIILPKADSLVINQEVTVLDFAKKNKLPNKLVQKIFNIKDKKMLNKPLSQFSISNSEIKKRYQKAASLFKENNKKDFKKIALKFILWIIFIAFVIKKLKDRKISAKARVGYYAAAIFLFGILFGSDPSPMGTVKDAIVLYGSARVIFMPRLVAFAVFIIFVIIANKSICAWGCQLGVLQDFIYRLGKDTKENSVFKQYKVPFVISNTIRIIFFISIVVFSFLWGFDIVHPIDPFKIYNPTVLTITGIIFIGLLVIVSVFVYRPWCNFLCPFGLAGWFFERFSFLKIKVNYDKCIACGKCEKACPSTVMSAILRRDKKAIPDCYSCGACMNVCPTKAIDYKSGKRDMPPNEIIIKLKKLDKKRGKK